MGMNGQRNAPAALYPGKGPPVTHLTRGLRKNPSLCRELKTGRPDFSQTLYWLSYPSSSVTFLQFGSSVIKFVSAINVNQDIWKMQGSKDAFETLCTPHGVHALVMCPISMANSLSLTSLTADRSTSRDVNELLCCLFIRIRDAVSDHMTGLLWPTEW
jgi:hypothetical protein